MGIYPPGDVALGEVRGPMREETESWLNRVSLGVPTQHATAREAHNRLMLTKALDLSAKRRQCFAAPRARRAVMGGGLGGSARVRPHTLRLTGHTPEAS